MVHLVEIASVASQAKSRQPAARHVCPARLCVDSQGLTALAQSAQMVSRQTPILPRACAVLLDQLVLAESVASVVRVRSQVQTAQHAWHVRQDTPAQMAFAQCVHQARSQTRARQCV